MWLAGRGGDFCSAARTERERERGDDEKVEVERYLFDKL